MKLELNQIRKWLITPTTFVSVLNQYIMQGMSVFIIFEYFYSVFWYGELLIIMFTLSIYDFAMLFVFFVLVDSLLNLLSSHYLYVFTEG